MAQAKIKKTISQVGYAPATLNPATGKLTYGAMVWLPHIEGGREYSADPNGELTEIFADGVSIYSAGENQGYDITLTTVTVTDDIDAALYGYEIEDDGGATEFANNAEHPIFALAIIEATTDGVGETSIWYNCKIGERASKAGQTSEGSGFDPQFLENNIQARPRMDDGAVFRRIPGKDLFTNLPQPSGTGLATMSLGGLSLSPAFRPDVTTYTATKTANSGEVVVGAQSMTAEVAITQGSAEIANGATVTWGTDPITVVVTNGELSKTYTITIGT